MYYVVLSCQVFPSETVERYVQAHGLMRISSSNRRLSAFMFINDTHRPMVRKTA
jgi:hypothetical protein